MSACVAFTAASAAPAVPGLMRSRSADAVVGGGAGISSEQAGAGAIVAPLTALRSASRIVAPLTKALQGLVPPFAAPMNGHVNFGLLEAICRATCWGLRV